MNSKVGELCRLTIPERLLTFFSSVILLRIFYLSAKRLSKLAEGGDVKLASSGLFRSTINATSNLNGYKSRRWIYCKENWVNMSMVVQTIDIITLQGKLLIYFQSYIAANHIFIPNFLNINGWFDCFSYSMVYCGSNFCQLKIFGINHAVWGC